MANYNELSALVVDNSLMLQMIHSQILAKVGFGIIDVAEDGQKAIDIHESGESYDLILMEMEMPVKDGAQVTRELRGMGVQSMIVGVTAYEDTHARREFIAAGLNSCLEKPLRIDDVAAIAKHIRNNQN